MSEDRWVSVNNDLSDFVKRNFIPNAVLVIRDNDLKKTYRQGVMDSSWCDDKPYFLLSSMVKMMTSYLILETLDREKIDINQPIGNHISFPLKGGSIITFRDLLTHCGGLEKLFVDSETTQDPYLSYKSFFNSGISHNQ